MNKAEYKGLGRRKSSIAKVRLLSGSGKILINKKSPNEYFPNELVIQDMMQPLTVTETTKSMMFKLVYMVVDLQVKQAQLD